MILTRIQQERRDTAYASASGRYPFTDKLSSLYLRQAIRDRFAWPGGYEIFGICSDGGTLCCECMRQEYYQIAHSRRQGIRDGWDVVAVDATCNTDGPLACDHCNAVLIEEE